MGRDKWFGATIALISVVVTLLGGYLTIGDKLVSGEELTDRLETTGPYPRDKEYIKSKIAEIDKIADKLAHLDKGQGIIEQKIDDMNKKISEINLSLKELANDQRRESR